MKVVESMENWAIGSSGWSRERRKAGPGAGWSRGKRQAANDACRELWRTRPSSGGQEGRKGKACPSLLEASRVHRATSSPPQLKAFYCCPCSCGFSRQKWLCYGGARGPGSSCECVDFLVAAGLLWMPRWDPSVCSLLCPVFHLSLTEYIL